MVVHDGCELELLRRSRMMVQEVDHLPQSPLPAQKCSLTPLDGGHAWRGSAGRVRKSTWQRTWGELHLEL